VLEVPDAVVEFGKLVLGQPRHARIMMTAGPAAQTLRPVLGALSLTRFVPASCHQNLTTFGLRISVTG
jgi:hypothetical protein